MSRQSRILVVVAVMAVVAVVALAIIARQYASVRPPLRSVADVEPSPERAASSDAGARASETPSQVETIAAPEAAPEAPAPAGTSGEPGTPDAARLAAFEAFVAGREAVRRFAEENPGVAAELVDEAGGVSPDREQVKMHTFRMMEIRVLRAKAIEPFGLDEDAYKAIRGEFRRWRAGDASVEPGWARVFDADPDRADRADLGDLDPLDF
jgi:hypothetical protein